MNHQLGSLLEAFLSDVSHPRGRVLSLLSEQGVTADQGILLRCVQAQPGMPLSSLAERLGLSLPSVSQMAERLVKLGYVTRREDPEDRRRKSLAVTPKAFRFLTAFRKVRAEELTLGTARLSAPTRRRLVSALEAALEELQGEPS
ncbi:MarR family winged helix-turn-helix transcriptional regulator [Myxococcus sp. K38C18041901]|uniref:MarR family winged helix-turn-helix transcriptional regulator n=1 Tax=Myxococcus guangdongensis TaxID=2906760 RepID=UPI0020A7AB8B|nr:MarR family winged helix-turn-helix transcriptional regulator [Myxococcus guangdongensis]MCP3058213.1 MarR family winged helix-turn-helix transcriptional regulator [Myxococcus guangdongensis]